MNDRRPEISGAAPNRTFGLLTASSLFLVVTIAWSTHHLLLAGAPPAIEGMWPGMSCLLVPEANDIAPHIASYGFLLAILAGFG